MMLAQYILVGLVALAAVVFLARKAYKAFTQKGCVTGTCGCATAEIKQKMGSAS